MLFEKRGTSPLLKSMNAIKFITNKKVFENKLCVISKYLDAFKEKTTLYLRMVLTSIIQFISLKADITIINS